MSDSDRPVSVLVLLVDVNTEQHLSLDSVASDQHCISCTWT